MSAPMKGHEFAQGLKEGRYTSLGSYPRFLVLVDGAALCIPCATAERSLIRHAAMTRNVYRDGWAPLGFDVNWEDSTLYCDHCSGRIESAYAEDDAEGRAHV